jgi:Xaa-Pro dipeptidase
LEPRDLIETKAAHREQAIRVPFNAPMLDDAMDAAGIDVLVATSKHNVQYLLGGYRYFFFERMDAIGQSRYLPILIYPRGAPEKAAYFGNAMESFEHELTPLWPPEVKTIYWATLDAIGAAIAYLKRIGLASARIGVESSFMPVDAYLALRKALPAAPIREAFGTLEDLRAVKTPTELNHLRVASEGVVDAMLAVFAAHGPGASKRELVAALRREEQARGLTFEYCLPTVERAIIELLLRTKHGRRAISYRLTPVRITRAISETYAAWQSLAIRTVNCRTC